MASSSVNAGGVSSRKTLSAMSSGGGVANSTPGAGIILSEPGSSWTSHPTSAAYSTVPCNGQMRWGQSWVHVFGASQPSSSFSSSSNGAFAWHSQQSRSLLNSGQKIMDSEQTPRHGHRNHIGRIQLGLARVHHPAAQLCFHNKC